VPQERMLSQRDAELSAIAREVRYRDALWSLKADLDRLQALVTLSGRARVAKEMGMTIDRALDVGGGFDGLPEHGCHGIR
jgi:hypothetical protein